MGKSIFSFCILGCGSGRYRLLSSIKFGKFMLLLPTADERRQELQA
jgi:hypothetical protein